MMWDPWLPVPMHPTVIRLPGADAPRSEKGTISGALPVAANMEAAVPAVWRNCLRVKLFVFLMGMHPLTNSGGQATPFSGPKQRARAACVSRRSHHDRELRRKKCSIFDNP